jgi:hypothetical protein
MSLGLMGKRSGIGGHQGLERCGVQIAECLPARANKPPFANERSAAPAW